MTPNKITKIVCTIGPASSSLGTLTGMIEAGMNIARFNFSHGTHESNVALLNTVREAASKAGAPVQALLDLQGPKLRIGILPEEGLVLTEGDTVTLQAGVQTADAGIIPVPYESLATQVKKGGLILLADGTFELEVLDVQGLVVTAKVLLGGTLISKKGINVPNVSLVDDAMTDKDIDDLQFGLQHNMDYVALSFVRSAEDVRILKSKMAEFLPEGMKTPLVMAKIEMPQALANFDEILQEVDAIMVARGDLGLESPMHEVPIWQKRMIKKCREANKFVITATEMMGSMQYNPRPTRAEVSDVANAVLDHTDAVMLSGESAMGKYPVRTVKMMTDIIIAAEQSEFY
ncbi:MAG TPA: pyruvate kinase [Candidatus Andersenbacteria bacterium]|nr:pyruvate kinase [Candidatus Andersenbacteria bacterium]